MSTQKVYTHATIFSLSQVLLGVLNYLFQLLLINKLGDVQYGEFLSWYSMIGLFLVLGSVAQNYSNFQLHDSYWIKKISIFSIFFIFSTFLFLKLLNINNINIIGTFYILSSILSGFIFGQLQGRFYFISLAVLSLLSISFRIAWTLWVDQFIIDKLNLLIIAKIILFTHFSALILTNLFAILKNQSFSHVTKESVASQNKYRSLLGSFLLSSGAVIYPQLDFMTLVNINDKLQLGHFAQFSMQIRSFYFIMMILFQVLLPFQIHNKLSLNKILSEKKYSYYYLLVIYICTLVLTFLIYKLAFISNEIIKYKITFFAILNLFFYVYFFIKIQTFVSLKKIKKAVGLLILTLLLPFVNYFFLNLNIEIFYLNSFFFNQLIFFGTAHNHD